MMILLSISFVVFGIWMLAEFRQDRAARVIFGSLTLFLGLGAGVVLSMLNEFNYNAWYGSATKNLIDTIVIQVEDGNLDRVMTVLRGLNRQYQPTYENRAGYRDLVEEATAQMRGEVEIGKGGAWDTSTFDHSTWLGHWEDEASYFWIVIDDVDRPYIIVRYGYPGDTIRDVSVSDDFRSISFQDWGIRHTLRLLNKYEAEHEWFDLEKQSVWRTDKLHKLIRATPEQRVVTQQSASK